MIDCIRSTTPIKRVNLNNGTLPVQFGKTTQELEELRIKYNNFCSPNPNERLFVWYGQFRNGYSLSEIDFNNPNINYNFNDVKNYTDSKLYKFGLIGSNYFFYYNVNNGEFVLNEKRIKFLYKVNDKIYNLSHYNNCIYDDVITYKNVEGDFSPFSSQTEGVLKAKIYEYVYGYKNTIDYGDGVKIKFQPLVHIPINSPLYINLRITSLSDFNLDGEVIILKNDKIMLQEKASILANTSGQINWIVK